MKTFRFLLPLLAWTLAVGNGLRAQNATDSHLMTIRTNKPGAEIPPTLYGLFFEDINFAADGGLYAELVKNRSFEFPQALMGWTTFGKVEVRDDGPFDRCPHYVRLSSSGHREKYTGLENEGFFGIALREGAAYRFSVWARGEGARISVELENPSSTDEQQALTSAELEIDSKEWKRYELTLTAPRTEARARLRIFLRSEQPVDLEHISLFPVDTWQGRTNGLRKDLVQALADLKPGVLRFPGGCIVEGTDEQTRYRWKNTVGPVENRPLNENRWHYTFDYRLFPDYFQSGGLGFYEFFLLAEDIGAAPLPIVNCGLICQFQNDEEAQPGLDRLPDYIADALDLIEFANGDTTTTWGGLRARMGHPEPFGLKYIGIGNEQWGPLYPERLEPFVKAIREKHPEIAIVGSSGPGSEGEQFDYLWPEMKRIGVDLVDEHFYRPEGWFLSQGARYDNYDRRGPKVFAGEYACHGNGRKWNHFNASLMEAAFMTGLERNADVVRMATYAPLLARVEGWQWRPDLIWFDGLRVARTCSYLVQQLYSLYRGTHVLPLTMDGQAVSGQEGQDGLFASAVWDAGTRTVIVKVANTSQQAQALTLSLSGLKKRQTVDSARLISLHADQPEAENTVDQPQRVSTQEEEVGLEGNLLHTEIPGSTFRIYLFPVKP